VPSWDMERWDNDFLHSGAGRYQEAHENLSRLDRVLGVQPPDGWRRPMDEFCKKCWYGVVDGACVRGCTSLSGREVGGRSAHSVMPEAMGSLRVGLSPSKKDLGTSRPESDAEAA
jgi:hypothetical protein